MILYQDAALVVVNKPAGLSSEAGLPTRLRELWGQPDAYVGIVHRLDTGVSGLMVCARTPKAAAALTRQITQSQEAYAVLDGRAAPTQNTLPAPVFTKQYRAVLAGAPDETLPEHGILRDYLFKDSRKGRVFPVSRPRKGVREAVLEYRITASNGTLSLADITLHTGRTHQIRVHMWWLGYPLAGDDIYGWDFDLIGRHALHCGRIWFPHPVTGERIEVTAPPPEDFLEAIRRAGVRPKAESAHFIEKKVIL